MNRIWSSSIFIFCALDGMLLIFNVIVELYERWPNFDREISSSSWSSLDDAWLELLIPNPYLEQFSWEHTILKFIYINRFIKKL